jgi:RNA polymerase sigma factor (sigma-70 family)
MVNRTAPNEIDQQLLPFLNATSDAESQAALEELICKQAEPLVKDIVRFKLQVASAGWSHSRDGLEVDDVSSEVIVRLVAALRECKSSPSRRPIANLRSYVAVMAFNASDSYLRQKYPRRFSLKNKIKYILTHHPGLTLWETPSGNALCGFVGWKQISKAGSGLDQQVSEIRDYVLKKTGSAEEKSSPGEQVAAVCEFVEAPIEVDDLVSVMAEIWGIRDVPVAEVDSPNVSDLRDPSNSFDEILDNRSTIELVWKEILTLPVRQRVALLLNLRDKQGGSALAMLPILRVASIKQISEALETSDAELAALWNELPVEDSVIGERLGATRQQVSNLRKCARERLLRRLGSARESRDMSVEW